MELDAYDRSEILTDIHRIEEILTTDIFECRNCRHPLALSAFIELMICLYDLMCKAEKYCRRIDFVDDVINTVKIKKMKVSRYSMLPGGGAVTYAKAINPTADAGSSQAFPCPSPLRL